MLFGSEKAKIKQLEIDIEHRYKLTIQRIEVLEDMIKKLKGYMYAKKVKLEPEAEENLNTLPIIDNPYGK